jgi:hypothetical protein
MNDLPPNPTAIVAIRASARGLQAYTELLEALPANTGMAFVVVQHLAASQECAVNSVLPSLYASRCRNLRIIAASGAPFTKGAARAGASLVQTCRANEIEPHAYLRRVFAELPAGKSVEQIEALLPWSIQ